MDNGSEFSVPGLSGRGAEAKVKRKLSIFAGQAALVAGWFWVLLFAGAVRGGYGQGIPEPDLVMYGRILNISGNANLRLGYGTLMCTFRPVGGGNSITATTLLTNINNQFSYILRIPCETPVNGFAASTNAIQLTPAGIVFDRSQISWNSNLLSFVQPSLTNATFFASDRGRIERVDLTVSTSLVIDPLNGLPVDWELSYFGRTGIDPLADPDKDGLSNFAEYRAGTDPNDPASGLLFTQILQVTNGTSLKWLSADFKAYALQRSTSPAAGFVDIQTGIAGTAPTNTFTDTSVPGLGTFYYRLRIDDALAVAAPGMKFTGIQKALAGGIQLTWFSATNQTYALQRASNLASGFVDVATGIAATPPSNSYRDASATGPGPYFYRLRLQP